MKRQQMMAVLLAAALGMTGCSTATTADTTTEKSSSTTAAATTDTAADATDTQNAEDLVDTNDMFSDRDLDGSYKENECVQITLDDETSTCEDKNVTIDGQTVTITGEGTYLISGSLSDGSLVVDVDDSEKVQLVLDGVSITNKEGAAIQVTQADKVFVTLADGSENTLSSESFSDDTDSSVDGAIFSKEDLTLNGSGSLTVTSAGHGIVSKDDLVVTGGTYEITVEKQGVTGKDSVRIADGTFTIESGKDAIHSENSEDESKGWVYLAGGTYTLTADGDGISASGVLQSTMECMTSQPVVEAPMRRKRATGRELEEISVRAALESRICSHRKMQEQQMRKAAICRTVERTAVRRKPVRLPV